MRYDYITRDDVTAAKDFIKLIDDDVEIYKHMKEMNVVATTEGADKFASFWAFKGYEDKFNCLPTLYDAYEQLDGGYEPGSMEVLDYFVVKFEYFYDVLVENGYAC